MLATLSQHRIEPEALNELHDIVGEAVVLAHTEYGDNVGVVQLGRGARFAFEPQLLLGVHQGLMRQHLESDMPAQRDLLGLVNDPHPTVTDLRMIR